MSEVEPGVTADRCSAGIIVIGDEILKGHVVDVNSQFLCKELWNLGIDVQKVSVVGDSVTVIEAEVRHFSQRFDHVFTCGGIGPTHDDVTLQAVGSAFDEELHENQQILSLFAPNKLESCRKMAQVPISTKLCFPPQPAVATHGQATVQTSTTSDRVHDQPNSATREQPQSQPRDGATDPVPAPAPTARTKARKQSMSYPALLVHNVFVLPGVPLFLKEGFRAIKSYFRQSTCQFHLFEVRVRRNEAELADTLTDVQASVQPHVQLGSYPQFGDDGCQSHVVLRLESPDEGKLASARRVLLRRLSETSILETSVRRSGRTPSVSESSDSSSTHDQEQAALSSPDQLSVDKVLHLAGSPGASHFSKVIANTLCIIEEALSRYEPGGICLCFNGGKDCTVLMHLLSIVWHRQCQHQSSTPTESLSLSSASSESLVALYIRSSDPFPEVEDFIQESVERYNLDLVTVEACYKDALQWLNKHRPSLKAVLMGTRRTDPFASDLSPFVMTDSDWPQFMRVNPILDFSYSDIWRFLRDLSVPYCSLYDQGYTSLGGRSTTLQNPALRMLDEDTGKVSYLPAYLLSDGDRERDGRTKKKQ